MRVKIACLLAVALFLISACAPAATPAANSGSTSSNSGASTTAGGDLLADVTARGVLRIATDPAYPPQSELVADAKKPADSKCTGEEHAAAEFSGFDIDVAVAIAKGLGVEPCFVTPDWTLITSGGWAGRWDISVGSMTITPERMEKLYFAQPYYTTPAAFFVYKDNTTYTTPADLNGKKIGACTGCTYESYLDGTLKIPGENIEFVVKDTPANGYETDLLALQDLALGDGVRLDAVLTALPTGLGAIKDGLAIKQLGDAVYFEYLAPAIDKSSALDPKSFLAKVSEIVKGLHADGTLNKLSETHYGTDLVSAAGSFNLDELKQ